MNATLLNHIFYLVFSVASFAISKWAGSTLIVSYLVPNLITIVIALLAINIQTIAVMTLKLREISNNQTQIFRKTIKEIKLSIFEQILLLGISIVIVGAFHSQEFQNKNLMIGIGSFYVLYASLHIFIDISLSLIDTLFPESDH